MAAKKIKTKTTPLEEKISLVQDLATKLLGLMKTKAKAYVWEDKENEAVRVDIEANSEAGLLIGRHGETLEALQIVLGMMVRQKYNDWTRIIVNVGDWREKQEEHLKELAAQAARRTRETGEPQSLFNLTAFQRRIIHLELSKEDGLETESVGEGKERYLIVKPKNKKS